MKSSNVKKNMGIKLLCLIYISFLRIFDTAGELKGEHVCQDEERYLVNVTRHFLRNVTMRSYQWCLQVPPRCSSYTIQQINDSRTVEEERVRYVKKCCDGYKPAVREQLCVSERCPNCVNGFCNLTETCDCEPGYKPPNCSQECDPGFWGKNCENECECGDHGVCDKRIGRCYCPPSLSLNGLRCEPSCSRDKPDHECKFQCICFPIKSNSSTTETHAETTTEGDTELDSTSSIEDDKNNNYELVKNAGFDSYLSQFHPLFNAKQDNFPFVTKSWQLSKRSSSFPFSYFTTEVYKEPTMRGFEIDEETYVNVSLGTTRIYYSSTKIDSTTRNILIDEEVELSNNKIIVNENLTIDLNTTITPRLSKDRSPETTTIKESSVPENHAPTQQIEHTTSILHDLNGNENFTKPVSTELYYETANEDLVIDSRLFITIVSAVLFTVLIILMAAAFCVLHRLKEKKRKCQIKIKENDTGSGTGATVSVTARSIFHTPLPDPPIFHNPVFSLPFDNGTQPNAIEVVCNMNFQKTTTFKQETELFYDHPPSTGSYRAASIPEPPTLDKEKGTVDPIYDEIPSIQRINIATSPPPSYVSERSTLYMNTR